jgi:crotonobetainyl-CoA:carnitine CoA-transferase CaiB-like acyl-CoA transferase
VMAAPPRSFAVTMSSKVSIPQSRLSVSLVLTGNRRKSVAIDLKCEGVEVAMKFIEKADALLERLRLRVTERECYGLSTA